MDIKLASIRQGFRPQTRDCLICRKGFASAGAHNRVCRHCRNIDAKMEARVARFVALTELIKGAN